MDLIVMHIAKRHEVFDRIRPTLGMVGQMVKLQEFSRVISVQIFTRPGDVRPESSSMLK